MSVWFLWISTFSLLFLLTLAMMYLKKILFFEDQSAKTKIIVRYLLAGQILLSIGITILFYIKRGAGDVLFLSVFGLFLLYIYGIVAYSSFKSRKSRKWFAFFIPFPLVFFSLSIYNIFQAILAFINRNLEKQISGGIFLPIVFGIFVLLIQIARSIKGSVIWNLEKYTEGKNLVWTEEAMICVISALLGGTIIITSFIVPSENSGLKILILLYGFVVSIIVIVAIFSLHSRRYFSGENQKLQRILITTMADLVENRDENTGGHIRRTARYVEAISKELYKEKKFTEILTEEYIEDMIVAAPLHDIGKIHIPDAILDKPGRLTDEEFEIMKSHTTAGYNVIGHIEKQTKNISYIQIAKQMAKSHHEWINGKGYPEGISGDDIPLCAKIMAVADVFDALVSKRCYKEPMPLEKAYKIIQEETGTHFDETVSAAFFAAKDTIEQIMNEDNRYIEELKQDEVNGNE